MWLLAGWLWRCISIVYYQSETETDSPFQIVSRIEWVVEAANEPEPKEKNLYLLPHSVTTVPLNLYKIKVTKKLSWAVYFVEVSPTLSLNNSAWRQFEIRQKFNNWTKWLTHQGIFYHFLSLINTFSLTYFFSVSWKVLIPRFLNIRTCLNETEEVYTKLPRSPSYTLRKK